ncbi:MAG: ABC transporter substrate-binding protein [Vicinamibacteria bacterium]
MLARRLALLAACLALPAGLRADGAEELLVRAGEPARPGGRLVVPMRSEPKSFNPVSATDGASRDVYGRMHANLIRINRETQRTEPALARSFEVSPDGRRLTLELRRGLRFSDGHPFDADDVVFSWQAYLDERNHSPHRDLLIVGGKPIAARKLATHTVAFDFAVPYAVGERIFDGIAMLPRHLLERAQRDGRLADAWSLGSAAAEIAGLGPFRLRSLEPGERVVLERNPHYWKADGAGTRLPYLDELHFVSVPSEDAQVIRFQSGDADVISRMSAENFAALSPDAAARGLNLRDLGPGLEYSFLFFSLGEPPAPNPAQARRQAWFRNVAFRRAVSAALDRQGMARLAFGGRAAPLGGHVTPGNKLWLNAALAAPKRALESARRLLEQAGFAWSADGALQDAGGERVQFSILTNSSNAARVRMAAIAQEDLRGLGMQVHVVTLETRAVLDRVLRTRDYDACILGLGGGDADPNVEMNVWLSNGPSHLWNPQQAQPATPWEAEIDRLMRAQIAAVDPALRKRLYDRVQQIVADELPMLPLVAPNILVGAKASLLNLRPAILDHYLLWNADELAWRSPGAAR